MKARDKDGSNTHIQIPAECPLEWYSFLDECRYTQSVTFTSVNVDTSRVLAGIIPLLEPM